MTSTRRGLARRLELLRVRIALLGQLRAAGWVRVAAYTAAWALGSLRPAASAVATGAVVGRVPAAVETGLASPAGQRLLAAVAMMAALLIAERIVSPVLALTSLAVADRINERTHTRVLQAVNGPEGISHLEDPAVADLRAKAATDAGSYILAVPRMMSVYVAAAGAVLIVARASLVAGFVVMSTFVFARSYFRTRMLDVMDAYDRAAATRRRADYYAGLITSSATAKEARLLGLADWAIAAYRAQWWESVRPKWAVWTRMLREFRWSVPLVFVGHAATYGILARLATTGGLPLDELTAALVAAGGVMASSNTTGNDALLDQAAVAFPALRKLEAQAEEDRARVSSRGPRRHAGGMPAESIRVEGLRFTHPSSGTEVYRDLSLEIKAGQSLALVGANGAGKTTLVKLLAGLYQPGAGAITVDGIDLRDIDMVSWRRRLAVIFQDFARYPLSAADNVAFGALHLHGDPAALERAAARAGARGIVEALPGGWDATLSRAYSGGVDLSGGQWQRIALARALYAIEGGANVLVLDEPTASLDVRAEAELFERFLDLTAGLTTILVSHRFSTVRRAGHICVLEDGGVAESGSHAELMVAAGRYAEMFTLQAARFAEAPEAPEAHVAQVAQVAQ